MVYEAAVIGAGPNPDNRTVEGYAMGYVHGDAYEAHEDVSLVACADIVRENAEAFAEKHDLPADAVFEDYETMLAEVEPDVVSVTVPPAIHANIVVGCAESGVVDAIHCEKPMAKTWRDSQRMAAACDDADVALTFNHQRRFARPLREAKALLDDGAIGSLERIEVAWGDFYDSGSHTVDLCGYLNDERPAEWVIGQLDYRDEDVRFGVHTENQMLAQWEYDNGVYGLCSTGAGDGITDAAFHLYGTEGEIQIATDAGTPLEVRPAGQSEWEPVDCGGEGLHDMTYHQRAIADAVDAIDGEPSELRAENALQTTEILFAGYESVRRRGRVDLPLTVADHPLEAMVDDGSLSPTADDD